MIREICRDILFLQRRARAATLEDKGIAEDLLETLQANRERCVGMAANMIGETKRIICFNNKGEFMTMLNPTAIKKLDPYETEESCLSLLGGPRKTTRYRQIRVRYLTPDMKEREKTFTGFTAQIIQHELDHLEGILI